MKLYCKGLHILIFIFSFSYVSEAQEKYVYAQPITINDNWKTENFKDSNRDIALIDKMFNQIKSGRGDIHSILLVKDNKLIIEEYFDEYQIDATHDLRSATKSIRSILIGIAIDKGYIENVNDSIFKYLKKRPSTNHISGKGKITIKDLLTMSSGLDCNDWDKKSKGQEDKVYRKSDWVKYTLNLPLVNEPGEVSNYCSMGTVLVAKILENASEMSINDFADKFLFKPLGITNLQWGHTSNKEVISSAKRLYMTPRDMAKIGQLVLNKGKWNNTQIVSENWLSESIKPWTQLSGIDYGFLWWNIKFQINDQIYTSITATGNGGQYIFIVPGLDLVAVFTGGAYNSDEDKLPFAIMNDIILPTFIDE